ncbi:MAG TPA: tyrosine-protein kinase family protein [Desulfuromonadales bacterium]|nr:tyrosine-protein kinase family protein [Desulfuromonadales bacterium]
MSRLEKAMENAAKIRQGNMQPIAPSVPVYAPVPARTEFHANHIPPSADTVVEKITSQCPLLVNLNDPYSPVGEEFRKLKSALVKLTNDETFRNTIMVTSSVPNEGKSITSLNLAISLAQEYDHTVLLIDADLRRPSMHRYLEMELKAGLADCLLGEADLGDVICPTGIGKLSVISAGKEIANPVELFTSQKMQMLLAEVKHRYPDRYIIFDTPPVLPFAETRTLGHLVDGVLFVVKERLASQANVKDALEALKGSRMLGLVYNDTTEGLRDERYSSYRGYSTYTR